MQVIAIFKRMPGLLIFPANIIIYPNTADPANNGFGLGNAQTVIGNGVLNACGHKMRFTKITYRQLQTGAQLLPVARNGALRLQARNG